MHNETSNTVDTARFSTLSPAPFICASLLASYPSEAVLADLSRLTVSDEFCRYCSEAGSPELWKKLHGHLVSLLCSPVQREELSSRYINLFDYGSGESTLYETKYGLRSSQLKTGELADIAGFYHAFGFTATEDGRGREILDHIAVECEFYAILLAKQNHLAAKTERDGCEIVLDARRKFLQDHLGRYPAAIAKQPAIAGDPFYSLVFNWCASVIAAECERLGVGVVPVDYVYRGEIEEEMNCGAYDGLVSRIGAHKEKN